MGGTGGIRRGGQDRTEGRVKLAGSTGGAWGRMRGWGRIGEVRRAGPGVGRGGGGGGAEAGLLLEFQKLTYQPCSSHT